MRRAMQSGNVLILDVVYQEIMKGKDELSNWLKEAIEHTTCKITVQDKDIIAKYSDVQNYIKTCDLYKPQALSEWAKREIADPWLIATAIAKNYVIITFEDHRKPQPQQKSKHIKIPDVADHFGVKYDNIYYFMRKRNFLGHKLICQFIKKLKQLRNYLIFSYAYCPAVSLTHCRIISLVSLQ